MKNKTNTNKRGVVKNVLKNKSSKTKPKNGVGRNNSLSSKFIAQKTPNNKLILHEDRYQTIRTMKDMIENALTQPRENNWIKMDAVAATYFLDDTDGLVKAYKQDNMKELLEYFESSLNILGDVQFILLDSDSEEAKLREVFERNTLITRSVIQRCILRAQSLSQKYSNFKIKIVENIPCFIFMNYEKALIHPYLYSIIGHAMPTIEIPRSHKVYHYVEEHFEHMWDGCP